MATRIGMLNHFGASRIEPRLRISGKANVDGCWYARQTSLEILERKMLHVGYRSLPFGKLVLRTIRTSGDTASCRSYLQDPAATDCRAQLLWSHRFYIVHFRAPRLEQRDIEGTVELHLMPVRSCFSSRFVVHQRDSAWSQARSRQMKNAPRLSPITPQSSRIGRLPNAHPSMGLV